MKLRLLDVLRCPACRATLQLQDADLRRVRPPVTPVWTCTTGCPYETLTGERRDCTECTAFEVRHGVLVCAGCSVRYRIIEGVPRLRTDADVATRRTADRFGYLWSQSVPGAEPYETEQYHVGKTMGRLGLSTPSGLVLDAGCGDGIDVSILARASGVDVIGVDLSDGGCRTANTRAGHLSNAHVVQASLAQLPFADDIFDFVYSYGVLHHLAEPERGAAEIVRVARLNARVVAYLYEDFSERPRLLRWALWLANQLRVITTAIPSRILYRLCQAASPFVFCVFTLPARALQAVPALASLGGALPFRHGRTPFGLAGDLFDRLSAPIERRYDRVSAAGLLRTAGLREVTVAPERGWMVGGVKAQPGGSDLR